MPLLKHIVLVLFVSFNLLPAADLERIQYNHPDLVVDLGVGLWAWPMPVDWDGDGDLDLLVDCPCKPYNGIWFFENPGGSKTPVFKAGRRVHASRRNIQVCWVDGKSRFLLPGAEVSADFTKTTKIYPTTRVEKHRKIRANQWKYVDYDDDGALDLIAAVGIWDDYGWDNAYNAKGEWTNGPLRGFVYWMRNDGTSAKPKYAAPVKVRAGGKAVDVYGRPSPNFADFDGDGDLDLLCGEFVDSFTYFENTGTRKAPKYAAGRKLTHNGKALTMDLEMIMPSAVDWDGDGDVDLIVGDEDGRVALVEHTGKVRDGLPQFLPPVYFKQQADEVKFGALSTPVGFDWDGDGDEDIICGNTAGHIAFIENLSGPKVERPKWAAPKLLQAGGKTLRIMAGPNGSIQGPCERKWGYTTQTVARQTHRTRVHPRQPSRSPARHRYHHPANPNGRQLRDHRARQMEPRRKRHHRRALPQRLPPLGGLLGPTARQQLLPNLPLAIRAGHRRHQPIQWRRTHPRKRGRTPH